MECEVEKAGSSRMVGCWDCMPDQMLLQVFQFLSARELLNAGQTCRLWNRVSYDELLWKYLLYRDYKIDSSVGILPGEHSIYMDHVDKYTVWGGKIQ